MLYKITQTKEVVDVLKKMMVSLGLLSLFAPAGMALAADDKTPAQLAAAIDSVWVMLAAILVIFMQAGFALLEAGSTRMKNAGHVAGKTILTFVLLLLAAFVLSDLLISYWDPMVTSRRFYKNDFTKSLYHHGWQNHGPVFYGNSAVTGAYIEQDSRSKLIEMGLSYGKLTDLKAILEQGRFHVEDQLVIGIDVDRKSVV